MKRIKSKYLYVILASIVWMGCDLSIPTFERPQPEGVRDEKTFPNKLTGFYMNPEDSSTLRITKDYVIQRELSSYSRVLDSIEQIILKSDTSWVDEKVSGTYYRKVVGDSMFTRSIEIDTVFTFSSADVLRKFKRSYFLNHPLSSNSWVVTRIRPVKGGLAVYDIVGNEDLKNLQAITNEGDTVYRFDPTRREFKALMNREEITEKIYLKQK